MNCKHCSRRRNGGQEITKLTQPKQQRHYRTGERFAPNGLCIGASFHSLLYPLSSSVSHD